MKDFLQILFQGCQWYTEQKHMGSVPRSWQNGQVSGDWGFILLIRWGDDRQRCSNLHPISPSFLQEEKRYGAFHTGDRCTEPLITQMGSIRFIWNHAINHHRRDIYSVIVSMLACRNVGLGFSIPTWKESVQVNIHGVNLRGSSCTIHFMQVQLARKGQLAYTVQDHENPRTQ